MSPLVSRYSGGVDANILDTYWRTPTSSVFEKNRKDPCSCRVKTPAHAVTQSKGHLFILKKHFKEKAWKYYWCKTIVKFCCGIIDTFQPLLHYLSTVSDQFITKKIINRKAQFFLHIQYAYMKHICPHILKYNVTAY